MNIVSDECMAGLQRQCHLLPLFSHCKQTASQEMLEQRLSKGYGDHATDRTN